MPITRRMIGAVLGALVVYAALRLIALAAFRRLRSFRLSEWVLAVTTTLAVLALALGLWLWLGYGIASKVVMAVLIIFFPAR